LWFQLSIQYVVRHEEIVPAKSYINWMGMTNNTSLKSHSDMTIMKEDQTAAHITVYHGGVFSRRKTEGQSYLSFRAVK
jgi:hypothetical protein